eukprot:COSAG01_NODE_6235_length_3776_cov_48.658961_3_plen_114_part_00
MVHLGSKVDTHSPLRSLTQQHAAAVVVILALVDQQWLARYRLGRLRCRGGSMDWLRPRRLTLPPVARRGAWPPAEERQQRGRSQQGRPPGTSTTTHLPGRFHPHYCLAGTGVT